MVREYDEILDKLKSKQQEYNTLKIITNSDGTNREELEYNKHDLFIIIKTLQWVLGMRKLL